MNPLEYLVKRLTQHAALTESDRAAILELPVVVRTIAPRAYVVREGERPTRFGISVSGYVCRHKLTSEGERQIVGIHVPGDPFDFQSLFLDVADHNVQTLTCSQIAFVDHSELRRVVLDRPHISEAFLINVLVEASILREWLLNVGRRDAVMRVAHFLCELSARLEAAGLATGGSLQLPTTQEELGDALGLTSVHVSRTLKHLEDEGLIRRSKRLVVAHDWDKLRRLAGFNPRYLHLN